ncbi:MAG TPA: ATP-dependent DNA ligase [Chitinophagaceae bacterium]|nr:ATP-dependent DNA ligase [Chitinophagaceae bacterium]
MKRFAELVQVLGTSTKTNDKLEALSNYFAEANSKDKVWVIALFSGRRPRRAVNSTQLSTWCIELAGIPSWLYVESYSTVGDLGETIALLLPDPTEDPDTHVKPLHYYLETLISIEKQDESIRKQFILDSWNQMDFAQRFVFNKLITGSFRIGVSQQMMVNALSRTVQLPASVLAHRISGNWDPVTTNFDELLSEDVTAIDHSKPYPFYLAYALEDEPETLGEPSEWQAEWKWDGIRGQIIKRNGELFVWSRGEELMTEKFPEYRILEQLLPEGVAIDGEILPFADGQVLNFNVLQTRIGRKNVTKKNLQEAPAAFFAYDLLEWQSNDIREWPFEERRRKLEELILPFREINANFPIHLSPIVTFNDWDQLKALRLDARAINSEGIMLKRKSSVYQVGRRRGDWWKWKIDPLTIDAVMVYAAKGSGRRSNLYTDYTFAVRDGDKLVTFTKAYSGLTDKEFAQVDAFVKRNSLEKFGPVRTVKPELVFEIAFEGIAASNRHKSGVALRFPRMHRWRKDKTVNEINTLDDLKKMLEIYGK